MAKFKEISEFIDRTLDTDSFQDDSQNGIQVDSGVSSVKKIAVAVDSGLSIIKQAIKLKSQMLIVHHGLFWNKPEVIKGIIAEKNSGSVEAVLTGRARILNIPVMLGVFDFSYMGGSMGSVVGEKLARLIELGIAERRPVIIISASGGARMQEGIFSLMQMAKVSAALAHLGQARVPYLSVLTDPTTGGVAASFAMLGDVIIAEPKALIGFAGPRVIEQTIRQKLPAGFQRSEFLLEHGMLDRIVQRSQMKDEIALILKNFGFGG